MDTNFYGYDFDLPACELRVMKLDIEHRKNESDLIHSLWFDYSALHSAKATYLYAHLYKAQTRKFHEAFIDIRTIEKARPFTPDDIFMSRDLTAMWLARRACDALGMPYEYALQFAQKRALDRLYMHFPRPNQLYGEEFEIDLKASWEESLSRSLRYSRLPRYQAAAYQGTIRQKQHQAFVLDQIKKRQPPHHNIVGRLLSEGVLTQAAVDAAFPEAVVEQAKAIASTLGVSHR
jgi:hypothetical protein